MIVVVQQSRVQGLSVARVLHWLTRCLALASRSWNAAYNAAVMLLNACHLRVLQSLAMPCAVFCSPAAIFVGLRSCISCPNGSPTPTLFRELAVPPAREGSTDRLSEFGLSIPCGPRSIKAVKKRGETHSGRVNGYTVTEPVWIS